MLDVVQQKEGERKAGGRLDCPGSLAADDGHCFHRRDDGESCCWCEDECECHDEDFSASGVRGVHANDVAMAAAGVRE